MHNFHKSRVVSFQSTQQNLFPKNNNSNPAVKTVITAHMYFTLKFYFLCEMLKYWLKFNKKDTLFVSLLDLLKF